MLRSNKIPVVFQLPKDDKVLFFSHFVGGVCRDKGRRPGGRRSRDRGAVPGPQRRSPEAITAKHSSTALTSDCRLYLGSKSVWTAETPPPPPTTPGTPLTLCTRRGRNGCKKVAVGAHAAARVSRSVESSKTQRRADLGEEADVKSSETRRCSGLPRRSAYRKLIMKAHEI